MGNPGGDAGDGTIQIQRCPKCRMIFYDWEVLKAHIDWENQQAKANVYKDKLYNVLKSKLL